jgi:outer membrane protein assembly factor BamB
MNLHSSSQSRGVPVRALLFAAFMTAALACGPGGGSPIPPGPGGDTVPAFIGRPAAMRPLAPHRVPAHPFLAPQGVNGMHADSYCTGVYSWPGPLGHNPGVVSASLARWGGEAATVVFDRRGRLICVSGNIFNFQLLLLDPRDLSVLASHRLPQRASMRKFWTSLDMRVIMNDTSGGAYFHLDNNDRPIVALADGTVRIFSLDESGEKPAWRVDVTHDLAPHLPPGAAVTDAVPDWRGTIWFVTRCAVIGCVDRDTGGVALVALEGEEIQNSLAVAPDGVYIVSDHAIYRFERDPRTGAPRSTWREEYARGSVVKPGAGNQGSGTTPTLGGRDLVAITDNADGRVNLLVYRRLPGVTGPRLVCRQPLFDLGASASENSLIAYGLSLIVENNYLYGSGLPTDKNPRSHPGVTRVDILPDYSGCRVVWESREASQTTVPKLSAGNGLVYLYTRLDGTPDSVCAWYLTAVDFRTGETVFKIFTGAGRLWNNNYAPVTIGPDGAAYVGCYNGIMAVRDEGAPAVSGGRGGR